MLDEDFNELKGVQYIDLLFITLIGTDVQSDGVGKMLYKEKI